MYFDEDLVLDIRLNTLHEKVDKFIIAEATKNHAGEPKKLNFSINKFIKFKDKINYIVIDEEPLNIIGDKNGLAKPYEQRSDSLKRIELSYDYMIKALSLSLIHI